MENYSPEKDEAKIKELKKKYDDIMSKYLNKKGNVEEHRKNLIEISREHDKLVEKVQNHKAEIRRKTQEIMARDGMVERAEESKKAANTGRIEIVGRKSFRRR